MSMIMFSTSDNLTLFWGARALFLRHVSEYHPNQNTVIQ